MFLLNPIRETRKTSIGSFSKALNGFIKLKYSFSLISAYSASRKSWHSENWHLHSPKQLKLVGGGTETMPGAHY